MWKKERPLVNVCDGTIASDEMVRNVLSARKTGEDAITEFFKQFTTTGTDVTDPKRAKYNDPIKKQKIYTFTNQQQKKKKHQTIPEDNCKSSGNVLTQFDEKRLDMKQVLQWPVTSKPWAICSKVDQRRSSSKSMFRNNLQLISPSPCMATVASDVSCCIVDAMRVVKMIPITNLIPPTFSGWAKRLYNYMKQTPETVTHIVFDVYEEERHLNNLSKGRETKSRERKIADLSQQLPRVGEWTDFLTNSKNKCRLTLLLADFSLTESKNMGKDVYVTKGNQCYQSTVEVLNNAVEVPDLKSNHRVAGPRIALHTIFASSIDESSAVCIVADDTDVYILLLYESQYCSGKVYFRQGTGSSNEGITYHDVKSLVNHLGEAK